MNADASAFSIEKSGETAISNEEIRTVTERIEEEMYRVYGKVDNSYKNKFRSLLANISNMNNNVSLSSCSVTSLVQCSRV